MRKTLGLFVALFSSVAMAATTPYKITSDQIQFGHYGSTAPHSLIYDFGLGVSNPALSVDSSNLLGYNKNTFSLGDGTSSLKSILAANGTSPKPALVFNSTDGQWEFSNDGANFKSIGSGSGGGGINIMATNQDFEQPVTNGWTHSGGTFVSVTSGANLLFDKGSATWTASSPGQYFESILYTIPNGLTGANCMASIYTKGGDANNTVEVLDGSNAIISSIVLSTQSVATPAVMNFICPSSGQLKLRVLATSAAALVAVDNAYIGSPSNLSQISQAQIVGTGTYVATPSCAWTITQTTYASDFSPTVACSTLSVTGSASVPSSKVPAITFNNLAPGDYLMYTNFSGYGASAGSIQGYAIFDDSGNQYSNFGSSASTTTGTLAMPMSLVSKISYSSAGNHTFSIRSKASVGTVSIDAGGSGGLDLTFYLVKFPSSSQTAVADNSGPSMTNWTDYPLVITAVGSNPTLGTVVTNKASWRRIGDSMQIRFDYSQSASGSAGSGTYLFSLPSGAVIDTSKVSPAANFVTGNVGSASAQSPGAATDGTGYVNVYDSTHLAMGTTYRGLANGGLTAISGGFFSLSESTVSYSFLATIPIVGWTAPSMPVPILVGSVISGTSGSERIERATINNTNGSSSILTSSSNWISPVSCSGSGNCNYALSGFSDIPSCTCNARGSGSANVCLVTTLTSSVVQIVTFTGASSAQANDIGTTLICMGPR